MTQRSLIQHISNMPLKQVAKKVARHSVRTVVKVIPERVAAIKGTFAQGTEGLRLRQLGAPIELSADLLTRVLADRYSRGEFDLLGSGWQRVGVDSKYPGFLGSQYDEQLTAPELNGRGLETWVPPGNVEMAQHIWRLRSGKHEPIDWSRDFRSGYRWSERTASENIRYGHLPGVDIKMPWELGRLQHLPVLALAFLKTKDKKYITAFVDHICDFVATQTPGFGVQWRCTMDVGIRIANILLAFDLLKADQVEFSERFEQVLTQTTFDHARHIATHLEWHEKYRGNHFLANIVGLLVASSFLPASEESDLWLAYSIRSLKEEIIRQFDRHGANFEASTGYHRLSAEMAVWGAILVRQIPRVRWSRVMAIELDARDFPNVGAMPAEVGDFFSDDVIQRLFGMAEFLKATTRPDGEAILIGDHDSGRFFRLPGNWHVEQEVLVENQRDFSETMDVFNVLFGESPTTDAGRVAAHLLSNPLAKPETCVSNEDDFQSFPRRKMRQRYLLPLPVGILEQLEFHVYQEFGLVIWKSPKFYLSVRCGGVGQNGNGGHAHVDALSITLWVDGELLIEDPGTYVYSSSPKLRNVYRSALAHWSPQVAGIELGDFSQGLFRMPDSFHARVLLATESEYVGEHTGYGFAVQRRILLTPDALLVEDSCDECDLVALPEFGEPGVVPICPGYGRQEI